MIRGKICILALDLKNTPKQSLQTHVAEADAVDLCKHTSSLTGYQLYSGVVKLCAPGLARPSDPRVA